MHKISGRWRLGLALALLTTVLWGVLPIALKVLLDQDMDPITITWYRFLVAAGLLLILQFHRGALPRLGWFDRGQWTLLAIAVVGLTGNYALYLFGLDYITPDAAQMVIQLAPVLLLLGGLVIFHERFVLLQWCGLLVVLVGLGLFFNHRLDELLSGRGDYFLGVVFVAVSAVAWASYALAQKQLLKTLSSVNIMLLLYAGGVVIFLPASDLPSIANLNGLGIGMLAFASFNTLVAYGAFAEALDHWEASRVSAVLALAPLATLIATASLSRVFSFVVAEPMNALSLFGGLLVVGGSMVMALGGRRRRSEP